MRVCEKVRAYIIDNNLEQEKVAQNAGISNADFNAIMNGKKTLYAEELKAICIALNVNPEIFIEVKTA